jgi:glycerophosphoryl diester phosphodiesterase
MWNVFRFDSIGWRAMKTSGRPLVLGHRGASAARRENTLAAFAKARELGADGVELDVRRTADRQLVVHHDPEAEGVGLLADAAFEELRSARPDIPTLDEALEACAGMIVNVEVKCLPWEPDADADRSVVRAVVELLQRTESVTPTDVIVSSFDLGAVDAARASAPDFATGWLTSGQELAAAAVTAREHGHAWLNPDRAVALRTPADDIAAAKRDGVRVNVWTVDDPTEIAALAAAGVDALITNAPDVALETLKDPRKR